MRAHSFVWIAGDFYNNKIYESDSHVLRVHSFYAFYVRLQPRPETLPICCLLLFVVAYVQLYRVPVN